MCVHISLVFWYCYEEPQNKILLLFWRDWDQAIIRVASHHLYSATTMIIKPPSHLQNSEIGEFTGYKDINMPIGIKIRHQIGSHGNFFHHKFVAVSSTKECTNTPQFRANAIYDFFLLNYCYDNCYLELQWNGMTILICC